MARDARIPARLALGSMAALLAAAVPATPATTVPGLVQVLSPEHGTAVDHGRPLTVVLRRAGGVRITGIHLNGRRVTPGVTRPGPGRLRLTFRLAHGLRPGRNTVTITSRRGSAVDTDAVGVVRGRTRAGIGAVTAPAEGAAIAHAPVRATLRVPHRATRVELWLNGRRIPEGQWEHRWRSGRIRLSLTATDGLRHGANVLRMVALRDTWRQVVERRFRITGTEPLAAPGADRIVHAGTRVTLDGGGSVVRPGAAARVAADLDHEWRIVGAPDGSTARLEGADTATPVLEPDVPGTYTVSLVVRDGAVASAPTTMQVHARTPGLVPVEMNAADLSITIGGTTLRADPSVRDIALHYVAIDRRSGLRIPGYERTLPAGDATRERYRSDLRALGGEAIVIAVVSELAKRTEDGRQLLGMIGGDSSVVIPSGATWLGNRVRVGGFLVSGENGELSFAFGDYQPFTLFSGDVPAAANTITVDLIPYTATVPAGAAGVQVLRLDSATGIPVSNRAYVTRASAGAPADVTALVEALRAAGASDDVVFLATLGSPGPILLADGVIQALGGTPAAMEKMRGADRYGLVSAPPPPPTGWRAAGPRVVVEVGSVIDRDPSQKPGAAAGTPPVQISGHLSRRWDGVLEPAQAVPGPDSGLDFATVVYRPAVPWPHSQTAGEKAALAWIGTRLGGPADPRAVYTQLNIDMGVRLTLLQGLTHPGTGDFTEAEFTAVKDQLTAELSAVQNVRLTMDGIRDTFGSAGLQEYADIGATSHAIQRVVAPPPATSHVNMLRVFGGALIAAGKLTSGPAAQGLGFAGEVITVAAEFAHGHTINDPTQLVVDDATQLQTEIPRRINAYVDMLGGVEDAIVTDWRRLSLAQARITSGQWAWDNTTAAATRRSFTTGVAREVWTSLLGTVYTTYRLDPSLASSKRSDNGGTRCWIVTAGGAGYVPLFGTTRAPVIQTWGPLTNVQVIARSTRHTYLYNPIVKELPSSLAEPVFAPLTGGRVDGFDPAGIYPPRFAAELPQRIMGCMGARGHGAEGSPLVAVRYPD